MHDLAVHLLLCELLQEECHQRLQRLGNKAVVHLRVVTIINVLCRQSKSLTSAPQLLNTSPCKTTMHRLCLEPELKLLSPATHLLDGNLFFADGAPELDCLLRHILLLQS